MDGKTFRFVYSEWEKEKRNDVKASSLATYVTNADKHLIPTFGDMTMITEPDVRDFVNDKLTAGLSVSTVRDLLVVLRMIAKFGMRRGWNGYREWDVRLPRDDRPKDLPVLTVQEQRRLMNFLRDNFSFRNLGLYICLCTGLRIGEICALKWSDIRLDVKSIRITRTVGRIYNDADDRRSTHVVITTPKTLNSVREIPLCGDLIRMLKPFVHILSNITVR